MILILLHVQNFRLQMKWSGVGKNSLEKHTPKSNISKKIKTALLGKPVKAQMFCLGEKNPVVQLIQGPPLQLKVLPGEEFLFSVGQTTQVRLEHTHVTIVKDGDAQL